MGVFEVILAAAITGLGAGLGTSIGTYFSNKLVIKHLGKLEDKLKVKK